MHLSLEDWLKRKRSGPKPRKGLRRSAKPMNQVSRKQRTKLVEYAHAKRMHLKEHPTCQISPIIRAAGYEVRCTGRGKFIHHVRGRGKYLCDRRYFLTSCDGECHPQFVHVTHKDLAIKLGLLQK